MDKMKKKIIGAFIAIITVAALILAGYYLLSQQAKKDADNESLPKTEAGKLMAKDLDTKYPETPTEVVKLYWRISSCIYNDDLEEEELSKLLKQLRELYDEEFLAEENNSYDAMLKSFKKDKEKRNEASEVISATVVQKNDTLTIKELNGRECTGVISATLVKAKSKTAKVYEEFMCRRDSENKWRILGWRESNADSAADVGIK